MIAQQKNVSTFEFIQIFFENFCTDRFAPGEGAIYGTNIGDSSGGDARFLGIALGGNWLAAWC